MANKMLCTTMVMATLMGILSFQAAADSEEPLQDFCVADVNSTIKVNGYVCKDASVTTVDDFSSTVLAKPGNTTASKLGAVVTLANAGKYPALNTFGVSMARIDYAPKGLNPPHVHPRASELLFLEQGTLYVGFVTTENKLFAKTINAGELFLFPKGLVHFQYNVGDKPAVVIATLTSQNPGTSRISQAAFATTPAIDDAVLAKAFQIATGEVQHLKEVISKL